MDDPATELRLRYLYRDLVLKGKVTLPLAGARALVGPDCAYHLYGRLRDAEPRTSRAQPPDAQAESPKPER